MKPHTFFRTLSTAVGVGALLGMAGLALSAMPGSVPQLHGVPVPQANKMAPGDTETMDPETMDPVITTSLMSFRPTVTASPAAPPLD